jgi:hypothetical protein
MGVFCMNGFLTVIDYFVKSVLENEGEVDQGFIDELLSQGLAEDEIQQAFTVIYNLLINRRIGIGRDIALCYRHFTEEEERELGPEICYRLNQLQLRGLLSPNDLDYLIYGYFESCSASGVDEEFWKLLRAYRPDAAQYLDILLSPESSAQSLN